MVRLETVLETWKTIRQDTAQAIEDFPAGEMDFKATADMASFREISRHILDAGNALVGLLVDGETNLATPESRERMRKYFSTLPADAESTALAAELRSSVEKLTADLSRQPADFFSEIITRFDGQRVTRLEMLQFVKEHELTHRSQLFLYLRLKGIVPVTTRRRLAKQAGR